MLGLAFGDLDPARVGMAGSRGEPTGNLEAFRPPAARGGLMDAIVFADVTDPWAYVGATRFERAAATFTIITGEPVEIVLRAALQDVVRCAPEDAPMYPPTPRPSPQRR